MSQQTQPPRRIYSFEHAPPIGRRVPLDSLKLLSHVVYELPGNRGAGVIRYFANPSVPYLGDKQRPKVDLVDVHEQITASSIATAIRVRKPNTKSGYIQNFGRRLPAQIDEANAVGATYERLDKHSGYPLYRLHAPLTGTGEQIIRNERLWTRFALLNDKPAEDDLHVPVHLILGNILLPEVDQVVADHVARSVGRLLAGKNVLLSPVEPLSS